MLKELSRFIKKDYIVIPAYPENTTYNLKRHREYWEIVHDYLALHKEFPFESRKELLYYLNREKLSKSYKNLIIRKLNIK